MPTELWIAACIACLAAGLFIGWADSNRHLRLSSSAPRWEPRGTFAPTPEQGLLADALEQERKAA